MECAMQTEFPSSAEYEAAIRYARELRAKTIGDMLVRIGRRIRNASVRLFSLRKHPAQFSFDKPQIR